jgi:hypothetical protein
MPNKKPLTPLQRLMPKPLAPSQDLAVESAAAAVENHLEKPSSLMPVPPPASATTKRTFRWTVDQDRELVNLLDAFNRSLPPGAKRLKMEHVGRAMRRYFVSSQDPQDLLRQAYQEANATSTTN